MSVLQTIYLSSLLFYFEKQIWDWIVIYHFNKLRYQWGANSKLTQISASLVIVSIMEIFRFEVKTNQIKSNYNFHKLEHDFLAVIMIHFVALLSCC